MTRVCIWAADVSNYTWFTQTQRHPPPTHTLTHMLPFQTQHKSVFLTAYSVPIFLWSIHLSSIYHPPIHTLSSFATAPGLHPLIVQTPPHPPFLQPIYSSFPSLPLFSSSPDVLLLSSRLPRSFLSLLPLAASVPVSQVDFLTPRGPVTEHHDPSSLNLDGPGPHTQAKEMDFNSPNP